MEGAVVTFKDIFPVLILFAWVFFWLAWALVTTDLFLYACMAWSLYYVGREGYKAWKS